LSCQCAVIHGKFSSHDFTHSLYLAKEDNGSLASVAPMNANHETTFGRRLSNSRTFSRARSIFSGMFPPNQLSDEIQGVCLKILGFLSRICGLIQALEVSSAVPPRGHSLGPDVGTASSAPASRHAVPIWFRSLGPGRGENASVLLRTRFAHRFCHRAFGIST